MSCHSAPEAEASSSGSSSPCPPLPRSLTARGTPVRSKSWLRAWQTGRWRRLQSSLTSRGSTDRYLPGGWTSLPPASPASLTRSPGSARASRTSAGCGTRSGASFAKFDPPSSSWRTSQACLPLEGLIESSPTWPKAGGLRNGTAFLRPPSAPPTSEIGSTSWLPTPTAQAYGSNQSMGDGAALRPSLDTMARRGLLPTPRAIDSSGIRSSSTHNPSLTDILVPVKDPRYRPFKSPLPTPASRDWRSPGVGTTATEGRCADHLEETITGGRTDLHLNPRFVEWMMGWPDKWTETVSSSSEMESSHRPPPSPGACSGAG